MKICIPTYNRFNVETFKILSAFQSKDIYLFINNYPEEQKEEMIEKYRKNIPTGFEDINIVFLLTKGIGNARQAVLDYFPKGTELVMLDDDIDSFWKLGISTDKLKKNLISMTSLEIKEFFEDAFRICRKNNTCLFGIYPVLNPFYMDNKINPKGFVIGTVSGIITNDLKYNQEYVPKEDYEYTIKNILKFKKVVRFDNVTVKAGHYSNEGGVCEQRKKNPEIEARACDLLLFNYPQLTVRNPKRENEILIK